jgi:hypothetical protein
MDSIGILYSKKQNVGTTEPDSKNLEVELHMNYLKTIRYRKYIHVRSGYNRYLDIGIMVLPPVNDLDAIYIYLPFIVSKEDISDLGERIKESSLFCTLFNGDYTIANVSEHPLFHEVRPKSDNKSVFWLYTLGENTYSISNLKKGTLIKIELKELPSTLNFVQGGENKGPGLYFRLRISNLQKDDFYYEEKVSNDVFQSAFSKAELVDIRVNEIREFDKDVIDDLRKDKFFVDFSKFHFFFIGSSENEQVTGNVNFHDCRLLDTDKWVNYESAIKDGKKKYLAYHWSNKKQNLTAFRTCNIFLRTIYTSLNFKKSIKYCIIAVFLGFLGSLLCSVILECFNN